MTTQYPQLAPGRIGMIYFDDGNILKVSEPQVACVETRPQNNYLPCTSLNCLSKEIVDETGPCQTGSQRAGDPALYKMIEQTLRR